VAPGTPPASCKVTLTGTDPFTEPKGILSEIASNNGWVKDKVSYQKGRRN
jgi:hypothetical protein